MRRALLVGNSVSYSDTSKSITRAILARIVHQLGTLLADLEPAYAFEVTTCIDERGTTAVRKLEDTARLAARDGDLLLLYYFGHGDLSSDLKLRLLHNGPSKTEHDKVTLEQLETRISEAGVTKSLFLLDCCYAGAMEQTFPYTLKGNHCRIAATAPSAKAFVISRTVDDPIGSFTSALIEGFATDEACVSNADDRVTAASLFQYLDNTLAKSSRGQLQTPRIQGVLPDTLFEYRAAPRLRPGYSAWADEKTSYAKIVAICRALSERKFDNISSLHGYLTKHYRSSFQTLYKRTDGRFEYGPVSHKVVARYLGFIRRIDLLVSDEMRLTQRGRALALRWETRCNELLLNAVDDYLSERGMTQKDLVDATRRILRVRRIPTKEEVADNLSLNRYRVSKSDVGVLLDLLAYAGALRVAARRAYFPW
jgi:hypothetical protein